VNLAKTLSMPELPSDDRLVRSARKYNENLFSEDYAENLFSEDYENQKFFRW
jgi:hypothetical protein